MTNITLFNEMINSYNELSYTHEYIFGFIYKKNVYAVNATADILPYILKLDKASRGAGYSLRFRPLVNQKILLLTQGAKVVCSEGYFNMQVKNSRYNAGEIFEKIITENAGQTWTKDSIPFYMDGDVTINGIAYQIKFQGATFTNEKTLVGLAK